MKMKRYLRLAYYEVFKVQPFLLIALAVCTLVTLFLTLDGGFEVSERQTYLMFCLGVFFPLVIALLTNNGLLKEKEGRTAIFVSTRVNLAVLWLRRLLLAFLALAVYLVALFAFMNGLIPDLFPPVMALTLLVPALFFSAIMALVSALNCSATTGAIVGIFVWALLYFYAPSIYYRLSPTYFPFLEWAIYFRLKAPISALPINKIFYTAVCLIFLAITYCLYLSRSQVERFSRQ